MRTPRVCVRMESIQIHVDFLELFFQKDISIKEMVQTSLCAMGKDSLSTQMRVQP